MKQFNRFLCLMMAFVMIALALAACGGEEPQDTTPAVTTDGNTTAPTTTAPTTTAPTGNETTCKQRV